MQVKVLQLEFALLLSSIKKHLGENNEMLQGTLQLGISLLHGGNREVQKVNFSFFLPLSDFNIFETFLANVGLFKRN